MKNNDRQILITVYIICNENLETSKPVIEFHQFTGSLRSRRFWRRGNNS